MAVGGVDLFYKRDAKTWDVLPAASIIYQAGGEVILLDHGGLPLFPFPDSLMIALRRDGEAKLGNIVAFSKTAPEVFKILVANFISQI